MENKEVVLGIIGAGNIGKLHINNLKHMSGARIKTISDQYPDGLKEWFKTTGAENFTEDYDDILNDSEIDAVFICTPTDTHTTIIKAAAKAGKHIFCEKPISLSDDETLEAYDVVKKAGVKFQIGFNRRFDHNFSRVKDLVSTDKIGDLHILKITSRDPAAPPLSYVKSSGGMFIDMTIHDFDMARYIADSEIEEVFAKGSVLVDSEIGKLGDIDTAIITLKFANGAIGVIDNSREAVYGYDQRLEAFGSKGSAQVQNETETNVQHLSSAGVVEDKPLHFFLERYNDAFIKEVEEFLKSVGSDNNTAITFKDGIMAQRIALAAKESLESGQPVKVNLLD